MGLIKAGMGALGGTLADQWKEFFYCESMPKEVLVTKGQKRTTGRSSNTKGNDNIISNGSGIAVADGQCMIIVEQGKVVEVCAEPGEFTYDTSTEPSIFSGNLGESIKETFKTVAKRFTYGGDTGKDQRIYYFNTKEILENRFGTANPIPFRVVDSKIGLDIDVSIRCSGVYSYKIVDPLLFYSNVCGNVEQEYSREELDSTLKTEFISALQPAFGRLSEMELRPNQIVTHNTDLENAMNTALSEKWGTLRGLKVVSIALGSVILPDEDAELIKQAQRTAIMRDPTMAAATLVGAQADAMKTAAGNEAGAMTGFMGMGMAMNAAGGGMNAQNLFAMGQQQQAQQAAQQQAAPTPAPQAAPAAGGWKCACGTTVTGNFCPNCGTKRPAEDEGWTCSCGAVNKGKFCTNCGAKKPAGTPLYRCDKCGWEPEDPKNPPRFCPECGDIFDENDRQ
ncbi:SPFH domain-containing protein [Mediterraneibacter faecis]|uniref:SPFH domain-containing protein n=1 Tax=Mediterraneibacter faecis TaxID=592978 RepID=UPI001D07FE20|nr:SPFH domain-containing protein [Mediterraneibacter faecis]MCB7328903.1 SPFH domain-containing protein [Mediterraneibacter faecis]